MGQAVRKLEDIKDDQVLGPNGEIETVEVREEMCTTSSKVVKVKLYHPKGEETLSRYECNTGTDSCRSRCLYKMLMEDF